MSQITNKQPVFELTFNENTISTGGKIKGISEGTFCYVDGVDKNGKSGKAIDLKGTGSIKLPALPVRTDSFSVSVWVKWHTIQNQSWATIYYFGPVSGNFVSLAALGGPMFRVWKADEKTPWNDLSVGEFELDQWTHVVTVFDQGVQSLYVNGVFLGKKESTPVMDYLAEGDNYIGTDKTAPIFNGALDEFRVYDYALSQEEIESLYGEYEISEKKVESEEFELTISAKEPGVQISDTLYGIFIEDINFAADGGLYAELVKNRSFEFQDDRADQGALHGWEMIGEASWNVTDESPLNANNTHYLEFTNQSGHNAGIANQGFLDGIAVKENELYHFSVYMQSKDYHNKITVQLIDEAGAVLSSSDISGITGEWTKYKTDLKPMKGSNHAKLTLTMNGNGTVLFDMISLFPHDTYNQRENGLRKDIVEALKAVEPKFLRFPGGCIVEGTTFDNAYNWKKSMGDVAERKNSDNIWSRVKEHPYYMTYGLGFYEYFLLCEDLGCKPVPIVNCGMCCQIQSGKWGEAEGKENEELEEYIQDALDLIEYCNGSTATEWGGLRASMGHPEPFHLEYIGVGNEQWGEEYFKRYVKFVKAIRTRYPDIKVISSSGPFSAGVEYDYAWKEFEAHKGDKIKFADIVDEHYYEFPVWFYHNTNRYDKYDRTLPKVFLGEYAAKSNTLNAALAEAAYMTALERNGDIVEMAAYAPLFGNLVSYQWSPDMIWFDNHTMFGTVNYYIQQMFSKSQGKNVLKSELKQVTSRTETSEHDICPVYYVVVQKDDELIIKLVNSSKVNQNIRIQIPDVKLEANAKLVRLAGENKGDANTAENPFALVPEELELPAGNAFDYSMPKYSVQIITIKIK